jgi:zona occludens toxin
MVDNFVRKVVERHFHVVRAFGTHNATIYEFPTGIENDPARNRRREGVVLHKWRYPKEAFGWYKSSELHTVKARIPMRVWIVLASLLLIPFMAWLVYYRLYTSHVKPAASGSAGGAATAAAVASSGAWRAVPPRLADAMSAQAYLDTFRPRVPGLAFTAPAYDALTKPVEAPYPSVCAYADAVPCRCWSQRGFRLDVPESLCRQLAREPMDPYWLRRGERGFDRGAGAVAARDGKEGQSGVVPATPAVMPLSVAASAGES